jgi:beta-galactosidase GanA
VKQGTATQLVVDGKPFLILGGEVYNSSSSSLEYMQPVWPRLAAIPLNTVLTPLSWELVEPREGRFDFTLLDGLIQGARQSNLHLVFLWLASWKNGMSSYAPLWVKQNTERFPRVMVKDGSPVEILSPLGRESMQADARAFAAVMRHIREVDGDAHTVLMMQVENEVGVLGDSRDRSPAANRAFDGQVPKELMTYLQEHRDTLIPEFRKVWEAAGAKPYGTWQQVFGADTKTDEIFMAWNYGRYIQTVAAAGKAEYPIPLYVNTWLGGWSDPHPHPFPSGGPLPEVMDVWRAAGNSIDIYSPDVYGSTIADWSDAYQRSGNPLFIPEASGGATGGANVFYAIGAHNALGFSPFGVDSFIDQERPSEIDAKNDLGKSYEVLQSLASIILQHEGRGKMAGFVLDQEHPQTTLELNGYQLDVRLDHAFEADAKRGFGLIIALGPDEFLGAGTGFCVTFRLKAAGRARVGIGSVDEGTFADGVWTTGRRLNGDEDEQGKCWRFIPKRIHIEKAVVYRYE